jgi:regulator of sigma E protease
MEIFSETTIALFQFIAAIAALILIHELGHFLAAKLVGIQVEEFGIGFPPRLAKLFEAGGTIYSLNWIPLGGFVRPKGENNPEVPGSFAAASPGARFVMLAAGPAMNLIAAAILFAMVFVRLDIDITRVEIVEVAPNSPAEQAGLQAGDIIREINGRAIRSTRAIVSIIAQNLGQEIELEYLRGEATGTVTLVPRRDPPQGEGAIGILMGNPQGSVGLIDGLYGGALAVGEQARGLLQLPGRLLAGSVSEEEARLVGYKGMFDIFTDFREQDQAAPEEVAGVGILSFFGAISVSLGLLNLLPIPALDGGRILFLLPEIVIRKRIPPVYENVINLVGFAMLLVLLIYVNIQDFVNPINLP